MSIFSCGMEEIERAGGDFRSPGVTVASLVDAIAISFLIIILRRVI